MKNTLKKSSTLPGSGHPRNVVLREWPCLSGTYYAVESYSPDCGYSEADFATDYVQAETAYAARCRRLGGDPRL